MSLVLDVFPCLSVHAGAAASKLLPLPLHDALPIWPTPQSPSPGWPPPTRTGAHTRRSDPPDRNRPPQPDQDRKSTRLNSSHLGISYAVFCLKKKKPMPPQVAHRGVPGRHELGP